MRCRPRPRPGAPTLRSGPSWATWSTPCSGESRRRGWGAPTPYVAWLEPLALGTRVPSASLGRLGEPWWGCHCRPEEERRRLLQGTGVPEAVEKDLANIRSEYYSIVLPFMDAHPDLFSPRVRSLELYRQLVALVMAYRSVRGALQRTLFFFLELC